MKYQSRPDIVATILESASNTPISKTRLMYMSYLLHEKMTSFAAMLIQSDLLSFDNHRRPFGTTLKGQRYLELYDGMQQCMGYFKIESYKRRVRHLQTEIKPLETERKRNNELNDPEKLQNLADSLKLFVYQPYERAYRRKDAKYGEEAAEFPSIRN
jgi:predicted transcriptional regulator